MGPVLRQHDAFAMRLISNVARSLPGDPKTPQRRAGNGCYVAGVKKEILFGNGVVE